MCLMKLLAPLTHHQLSTATIDYQRDGNEMTEHSVRYMGRSNRGTLSEFHVYSEVARQARVASPMATPPLPDKRVQGA